LEREGIGSPDPDLVADVSKHLEASAVFLGEVLRSMMVDGYRVENKANDCGDYSQLQYLCVTTTYL